MTFPRPLLILQMQSALRLCPAGCWKQAAHALSSGDLKLYFMRPQHLSSLTIFLSETGIHNAILTRVASILCPQERIYIQCSFSPEMQSWFNTHQEKKKSIKIQHINNLKS